MITVKILGAENLPLPTKKERKTKIFCFSSSSCFYFYDSFKNKENTIHPKWNSTFDLDLFRCGNLQFKLYSSQLFHFDIFLGEVEIDFSKFLQEYPGKEIIRFPYKVVQYSFPFSKGCKSPNALLHLSFLCSSKIYPPLAFERVRDPHVHVWCSFDPPISTEKMSCVEFELFQAAQKWNFNNLEGYFYHINGFCSWENVGYNSGSQNFLSPTGFTPISTFFLERIIGKHNFIILNVHKYSGVITLNFVLERKPKTQVIKGKTYVLSKKKSEIGILKTVSMNVEKDKKYLVPIYMDYKSFTNELNFYDFPSFSTTSKTFTEISDQMSYEIPFEMSLMKTIQIKLKCFFNVKLLRTSVLPKSGKVSLAKTFADFNIKYDPKLRIYIDGSTTNSTTTDIDTGEKISDTEYWTLSLIIYDIETGSILQDLSKNRSKYPYYHILEISEQSRINERWNAYLDLDLDELGSDKVILLNINCAYSLESANSPGLIFMAYVNRDGKETMLYRNEIFADGDRSHFVTFCKFQFCDGCWHIFPMRHYFRKKKEFIAFTEAFGKNEYNPPKSFVSMFSSDSEDDAYLIENADDNNF